ncbi:hypothetical protein GCM10007301_25910 [Azorhizobium oxalatiphilum]|uniref:Uncharacterized protein n=1 Tax=Azorhizobium oxalatiphilum TaxID=980631 RepID=A0A917FCI2_9HYPH|nr:hypothetical protein [Azorhizobium oxalatiphilum]GGF64950.1 hypothetical protein GCM10007301_25910 [Azorhizobium oxalatiphilum]
MAVRALLLFLAAGFVWITQAFLAISLYGLLERHMDAPLAALLTALAALALTGLLAMIALWRRKRPPSVFESGSALGIGALSAVNRFAERHPIATVALAAGAGVLQAVLMGRRR